MASAKRPRQTSRARAAALAAELHKLATTLEAEADAFRHGTADVWQTASFVLRNQPTLRAGKILIEALEGKALAGYEHFADLADLVAWFRGRGPHPLGAEYESGIKNARDKGRTPPEYARVASNLFDLVAQRVAPTREPSPAAMSKQRARACRMYAELLAAFGSDVPALTSDTTHLDAEARALAILAKNPTLSDTEIAKRAGVSRTHLYRCDRYKTARKMARSGHALPRGNRTLTRGGKRGEQGDDFEADQGYGCDTSGDTSIS